MGFRLRMLTAPTMALVVCLSACTSDSGGTTTDGDGTRSELEGSIVTANGEIDPGLQPYIDIAVADLAERLAADPAEIAVNSATLVVWPDSSLGCPAPGQQYAQVTTDGALIVLTADGDEFRYHAGGSRTPFLCEPPGKSLTGTISTDL